MAVDRRMPENGKDVLGLRLTKVKQDKDIRLRAIAVEAGISTSYASEILSGKKVPTLDVYDRIVGACGEDPAHWRSLWIQATRSGKDFALPGGDSVERLRDDLRDRLLRDGRTLAATGKRAGYHASTVSKALNSGLISRDKLRILLGAVDASPGEIDQWLARRDRLAVAAPDPPPPVVSKMPKVKSEPRPARTLPARGWSRKLLPWAGLLAAGFVVGGAESAPEQPVAVQPTQPTTPVTIPAGLMVSPNPVAPTGPTFFTTVTAARVYSAPRRDAPTPVTVLPPGSREPVGCLVTNGEIVQRHVANGDESHVSTAWIRRADSPTYLSMLDVKLDDPASAVALCRQESGRIRPLPYPRPTREALLDSVIHEVVSPIIEFI